MQQPTEIQSIWDSYHPAPAAHIELVRYGLPSTSGKIVPYGARTPSHLPSEADYLVLPLHNAYGELNNLAYVSADRQFFALGTPRLGSFVLNQPIRSQPVYILSDMAQITGFCAAQLPCVVAFNPDNLAFVVRQWIDAGYSVSVPFNHTQRESICTALVNSGAVLLLLDIPLDFWSDSESLFQAIERARQEAKKAEVIVWPTPVPIRAELPTVSVMKRDMLPMVLADYIYDQSDRIPIAPDMVAVSVLVSLCSVLGARVAIKPKQFDDWSVVANLWGGFVAPPSSKKSGAFDAGIKPLEFLVSRAMRAYEEECIKYDLAQTRQKAVEKATKSKIDKAAKSGDDQMIDTLIQELKDVQDQNHPPALKRYKTNDSSPEALAELEASNPNGIMICRDELSGLLANLDQEGNGEARAFYLEGWNGTGAYESDRIMRGHGYIQNHCLTLLGGIQPDKLIAYLEPSIKGLGNDGLMQRFQLMVYPDPALWRYVDQAPNKEAREQVYRLFEQIDQLTAFDLERLGARPADDYNKRPYFRFTADAQQFYIQWVTQLELQRVPAAEHPILCEHLLKYNKLMPALALLFHLVESISVGGLGSVSLRSAEMAADWCNYLESHARRIYATVTDAGQLTAASLAARLVKLDKPNADKAHDWVTSGFTARQVLRKSWRGLTELDKLQHALDILVEQHWLMSEEISTTIKGGRPSVNYRINPKIFQQTDASGMT
ncbi:MAG: YfjI family protein [Moraxellaceae bacterium]